MVPKKAFIETNEEYAVPCKESEAFDNLDLPKFLCTFHVDTDHPFL